MSDFKYIKFEKGYQDNPHIGFIQLDRPKVLNALSTDLLFEVTEALEALENDPQIRVAILTGDDRAFAAGADIEQLSKATPIDQIKDNRFITWSRIAQFSKPLIAAVNGFALGGGCELAMTCDILIAGDNAKFGQPEISIGTTPGAGGTQRLTRLIGKAKAMHMVLTGEMIDAYQAEKWGLASKVVPKETLLQETFQVAQTIAAKAPVATKLAKDSVNRAYELTLKEGLEFERRNFYLTFASKDQKEGMRAFLEKRNAEYTGD